MMTPKAWAILLISILILVVMLQNIESITIQILFWHFNIPLLLLILLVTVIGFVIGYFICSLLSKKRK